MRQGHIGKLPVSMIQKNTKLYFRQVIPADVRPYFNRASIQKSLKTGNITTAKRKAAAMSTLMWDIFTAIRQGDSRLTQLSDTQLRQLADKWLMEILEADEIERRNGLSDGLRNFWHIEKDDEGHIVDAGYSQIVIEEVDKALETNDYQQTYYNERTGESGGVWQLKKFANEFIKAEKLDIIEPSPQHAAFMREMAKAYKVFLQAGQLRTLGDYTAADELISTRLSYIQQRQPPIMNPQPTKEEENDPAQGTAIELSAFIPLYMKRKAAQFKKKEQVGILNDLTDFMAYVGDKPLHKISMENARDYRELLYCIPINSDQKKYKDMRLEELANLELEDDEMVAPRTAYKRLARIRAALNWGKTEGYRLYPDLPRVVGGPKPTEALPPDKRRDPFSAEDCRAMFNHAGYTDDSFEFAFMFWLPLMGLYTGARLKELCQLDPQTDIFRNDNGIWFFDMNSEGNKTIKTDAGIRKVPIHQMLINIGFLNYAEKQKDKGYDLLFPELENKRSDEDIIPKASRWFNDRFRKDIGIESVRRKIKLSQQKKDFHAFRHHFASYCKMANIDITKYQECIGHDTNSGVTGNYSGRYSADILYNDVVVKLNFDTDYELNLSRLKESKYAKR